MKNYPTRTPTQWANRYIGQLLSRLEEIETEPIIECPCCGESIELKSNVVILPETAKKDIRTTIHACIKSVVESRNKEEADEEGSNR